MPDIRIQVALTRRQWLKVIRACRKEAEIAERRASRRVFIPVPGKANADQIAAILLRGSIAAIDLAINKGDAE